jgi:hypothetical protein
VWRHDRRGRLRRRPQQGEWSRKSHCKSCDRQRALAYYDTHRDELYAKREAVREAAWQAELKALEKEHRKRVAANKKQHDAQVRRQKEFLRSIGVPDLSPEEVTEREPAAALPQAFRPATRPRARIRRNWVVGDEPYVSLHIMGSERYVAPMRGEDVSVDPDRDPDETAPCCTSPT